MQLRDVLISFEKLRSFAEKLNADLPTVEMVVTDNYERKIAESVETLFRRASQRIATVDAKTRTKLSYIDHAMQARIASRLAVQNVEHDQYVQLKIDELIQQHQAELIEMRNRNREIRKECMQVEQDQKTLKMQLDKAKAVLMKNGITLDFLPSDSGRRLVLDAVDSEGQLDLMRKTVMQLTKERSILEKHLKSQKTMRLDNLRAFQHDRRELEAEIARLRNDMEKNKYGDGKGTGESGIRKKMMDQLREDLKKEQLAEQLKWIEHERKAVAESEERLRAELQVERLNFDRQMQLLKKEQASANAKREEEHAQELQRIKQAYEKKLLLTQKSMASMENTAAIQAISDRQAQILRLASNLYGNRESRVPAVVVDSPIASPPKS